MYFDADGTLLKNPRMENNVNYCTVKILLNNHVLVWEISRCSLIVYLLHNYE